MQGKLLQDAEKYKKSNQRRRVWRKFVQIMACVVVFCTTYALILPAITMEKLQCGKEEHIHSESCYRKVIAEPERLLVCTYESLDVHVHTSECYDSQHHITCGYADYVVHKHTDACKDENGTLVCQLPVVKEHIHTDDCYRIPEVPEQEPTQAVHRHSTDCYTESRGELICQTPATEGHSHDDACYTKGELLCQLPEQAAHAHDESCSETVLVCDLTVEPHNHGDSCYEQLVCELPEDETHTHSDECSGKVLICELVEQPHDHTDACWQTNSLCDLPETEGHAHSDACYEWILECELAVQDPHSHTDNCYEKISTLTCGLEESTPAETEPVETSAPEAAEPELVCQKDVIQIHSHDDTCYETTADGQKQLICTKPVVLEHVHGESCFVTEEADPDEAEAMTCTLAEGHTHEESCYDEGGQLICEKAENHTHGDLCYGTWELICGKEEHTHTEECYETEFEGDSPSPTDTVIPSETETVPLESVPMPTDTVLSEPDTKLLLTSPAPTDQQAGLTLNAIAPAETETSPSEEILGTYLQEPTQIGTSGVYWEIIRQLNGELLLRFTGEGPIPDFDWNETATNKLWRYKLNGQQVHIEFGDGVTVIGAHSLERLNIASIDWGNIMAIHQYGIAYGSGPSVINIPGSVKEIKAYAFAYRGDVDQFILNEGTEELSQGSLYAGNYFSTLTIPSTLHTIDSSPMAKVGAYEVAEGSPYFASVDGVLFSTDLKTLVAYPSGREASSYRIPDGTTATGLQAFAQAQRVDKLIIPSSVRRLGGGCFEGMNVKEVYFEDYPDNNRTGDIQVVYTPLKSVTAITNVRYPENAAITLPNLMEEGTEYGRYTHFTIPSDITSIGNLNGKFPSLETLTYNAANASISTTRLFNSCAAYDLVIGSAVNHLPAKFSIFVSKSGSVHFQRNADNTGFYANTFTVDAGAFSGADQPLAGLFGTLHVDTNGVVYQLNGTNAKVVYVSEDCAETLTIPAKITTDANHGGHEYTVTAVGSDALRAAKNLVHLNFEDVTAITSLESYAMANCPTLTSVNEATTKDAAAALFEGAQLGEQIFYNTRLSLLSGDTDGDGLLDGTGQSLLVVKYGTLDEPSLKIDLEGGTTSTWVAGENGTGYYQMLTGDAVKIISSVGNTSGNENYVYRVYFRTTGKDAQMGIQPGNTVVYNEQVITCYATEFPNVVYLEFVPTTGATVSFPTTMLYPTGPSAGGSIEVWGVIQIRAEAATTENKYIAPSSTIQLTWITQRDDFVLSKLGDSQNVSIVGDGQTDTTGNSNGKPGANLNWTVSLTHPVTKNEKLGKDYATSVIFTDRIRLPAGFEWNDAVKALTSPVNLTRLGDTLDALKIDNQFFLSLSRESSAPIKRIYAYYDAQDQALVVSWEKENHTETEMDTSTVTVTVYPEAITIDMSQVDTSKTYEVTNSVSAQVYYTYSDPATLGPVSAVDTLTGGNATIGIRKESFGANYFGEDINYKVELYNTGAQAYVNNRPVGIADSLDVACYITPANIEKMFAEAEAAGATMTITISQPRLSNKQTVTAVDGTTALIHGGNSTGLGEYTAGKLVLSHEGANYKVVVDDNPQKTFTSTSVSAALDAAGYVLSTAYDNLSLMERYRIVWMLNSDSESFRLGGGTVKAFNVYATIKGTFHLLTSDWPSYYASEKRHIENWAAGFYLNESGAETNITGEAVVNVIDNPAREIWLGKSFYKNGQSIGDSTSIYNGDVLTYQLKFQHWGSGSYENLPMVDDLYGSQYLLVPVEANPDLADEELDTHTDGGIDYYILSDGTYSNVAVGLDDNTFMIAHSITVRNATSSDKENLPSNNVAYSGKYTEIKWYFRELPSGTYTRQLRYKTLVDYSLNTSPNTYTLGNGVWLNDRPNARIYSFVGKGGTIIEFDKKIVTKLGTNGPAGDILEPHTTVAENSSVTYRLALHSTGYGDFYVTGADVYDALPLNYQKFTWSQSNVTLSKIETEGNGITYTDDLQSGWYISPTGQEAASQQYIHWPDQMQIKFTQPSTLYLYFTLTFPAGEAWDQYVAAADGRRITNTLHTFGFPSTVTHDLVVTGEAMLQKGVSGLYHYGVTDAYATSGTSRKYQPSGTTRSSYKNTGILKQAVHYYVTIYNGENMRLYLDDLHDKLPTGFAFMQMLSQKATGVQSGTNLNAGNSCSDGSFVKVGTDLENVVYCNATITPVLTDYGVKFRISSASGSNPLRCDDATGKYYLNRGEALVFGYVCSVGLTDEADPVAVNAIAMHYDDYLGNGLTKSDISVTANNFGQFQNDKDGSRDVMFNDQATDYYHFPDKGDGERWLLSKVELNQGGIAPGISKSTEGSTHLDVYSDYAYGVDPAATIHWKITLENAGDQTLYNYIVADVMPKPYLFEGLITFKFYDPQGNFIRERQIGTIAPRQKSNDPIVLNYEGKDYTIPLTGAWVEIGGSWVQMSARKDASGNEELRIHMVPGSVGVPEGGRADVFLSSCNPTGVYLNTAYTNRAMLYPTQTFSADQVSEGRYVVDEERPGVASSSHVNVAFGYATSSTNRVTEYLPDGTVNTAVSTNPDDNGIVLLGADRTFEYAFTVGNTTEKAMTKLVILNNLPEDGDHSPFDTTDLRNSAFTVSFAQNPNFQVKVKLEDGTVRTLDSNQFSIEYSTSTDFGDPQSDDWKGVKKDDDQWHSDMTGARSFRLIINDDTGQLIPANATVQVTFNATAPADAPAGSTAWNSFGYHYALQGVDTELEAMPGPVAISMPSVPTLKKQLLKANGVDAAVAEEDLTFTFLVYEGTVSTDAPANSKEVSLVVPKGASESQAVALDGIAWKQGQSYTIVELTSPEPYRFHQFNGVASAAYTFTYNPETNQALICSNILSEWEIQVNKVDSVEGDPLPGAVFGLYSLSQSGILSEAEAAAHGAETVITVDGTVWYLKAIGESDADGALNIQHLTEDQYYLLELKAPDGYNLPETGQIVYRVDAIGGIRSLTVKNRPGYEIPETGGAGTTSYTLGGLLLMMAAAILLYIHTLKRRKEDLTSF